MVAGAGPYALEYIDKANQIAGNILLGVGDRVPYARLRRQMNYGLKVAFGKEALHTFSIREIKRDKPELGPNAEFSKPRILKSGVVVVVQVVYPNHFKPIGKKPADEMGANKTCRAGDQDSSVFCSLHHCSLAFHWLRWNQYAPWPVKTTFAVRARICRSSHGDQLRM